MVEVESARQPDVQLIRVKEKETDEYVSSKYASLQIRRCKPLTIVNSPGKGGLYEPIHRRLSRHGQLWAEDVVDVLKKEIQ